EHHRRGDQPEGRAQRPHEEAGPRVVLRRVVPGSGVGAARPISHHRPPTRPCGSQGETVMNVRGAAVQSGLAALGLVVAYTTWQREPERAPGEVVVVDVNKSDVKSIRLDDGNGKTVELERRQDGRDEEPRVWLKLSADAKAKPPKPAREVPGNEGADRLWDKFAPLHATRALGTLPA